MLPVDANDLISTHFLLFRDEALVMAIRWTSLRKCSQHYTSFPGLSLLQQAQAPEHVRSLETIIANLRPGGDLYYSGSLAIEPSERGDREKSKMYREILTAIYVGYQSQTGAELMAGGTCRFKIDRWLASLGHQPLTSPEIGELPPINVKHLASEEVRVMHMREFSLEARRLYKKWKHLWQARIVLGDLDGAAQAKGAKTTAA